MTTLREGVTLNELLAFQLYGISLALRDIKPCPDNTPLPEESPAKNISVVLAEIASTASTNGNFERAASELAIYAHAAELAGGLSVGARKAYLRGMIPHERLRAIARELNPEIPAG
jgi:hypothetical protein